MDSSLKEMGASRNRRDIQRVRKFEEIFMDWGWLFEEALLFEQSLSAEPRTVSILRVTFSGTFEPAVSHISVDFFGIHAAVRGNGWGKCCAKGVVFPRLLV